MIIRYHQNTLNLYLHDFTSICTRMSLQTEPVCRGKWGGGGRDREAGARENRGREGYGRQEKKGQETGEKFIKASSRYLVLLIIQSKKRTQQRFLTSI